MPITPTWEHRLRSRSLRDIGGFSASETRAKSTRSFSITSDKTSGPQTHSSSSARTPMSRRFSTLEPSTTTCAHKSLGFLSPRISSVQRVCGLKLRYHQTLARHSRRLRARMAPARATLSYDRRRPTLTALGSSLSEPSSMPAAVVRRSPKWADHHTVLDERVVLRSLPYFRRST